MKTFFTITFLLCAFLGFAQPSTPLPAGYTWVSGGSSTYLNGPFYTGNASGNNSTTCCGGVSTTCGSNDTSTGANVQCSTVPWSVVGTPGASFIQHQRYGNTGTCNNTYADLAVPCNPGVGSTSSGSNWPSTTSETRRITMNNWNNTNPESAISALPLASRTSGTVWLPTSATLRFRDDGIGNGTGVGGDEFRLTMVGGDNNTCSSWNITATWQLDIDVPAYSSVSGTKINNGISQSLTNVPNAVNDPYHATNNANHTCCSGGCSFQSTVNSWYFLGNTNTASSGNGFAQGFNILPTLVQNGSTFNVDFKGIFSISIDRFNASSGDARASMGPGMGGKVELEVIYQIWNIQAPLPVALSHFEAIKRGNETLLQWTTMSETNNEGFNMQKSTDGINWETFDFVAGQGNSNQKVEYTGIDYKPLRGKSYYRLEQMDYDGSIHYTDIRSVNHANLKSNVQIYPNPSNQYINITGIAPQDFNIEIYNSFGKLIDTKSLNSDHEPRIDISALHHGMYYIKINTEGNQEHFKFIKSE